MENLTPEQRDEIREEWNELHVDAKVSVVEMPSAWPRPIPVSERLPEVDPNNLFPDLILAYCADDGDWGEARFFRGRFRGAYPWTNYGEVTSCFLDDVTHWLPMPPKPVSSSTPQ